MNAQKLKITCIIAVISFCITAQLPAQILPNEVIDAYFKAFNNASFEELTKITTNDITITEGDFVLCRSVDQLKTVFQWDSVFIPEYKILDFNQNGAVYDVVVSKMDDRVRFLHDIPLVSNIQFTIEEGKIKKQTIGTYSCFDMDTWRGRLKGLVSWIQQNHPDLNGFERDISPKGAINFIKSIRLYSNRELNTEERIFIDKDIQLIHLRDSVFIHETWTDSERWGRFSSNGMVITQHGKAIMVDTPMDNTKTERLYNYLKNKMGIEVVKLVPGHYHNDCIGGIEFLHSKGVQSLANILTVNKCIEEKLPVPRHSFTQKKIMDFMGLTVECAFYGGGHSFDNIVVWSPESKILFGGCLVKSQSSRGLGNLNDAVVDEWASTIEKIKAAFPETDIVVPGHGSHGGKDLLSHTIDLVKSHEQKE
ncbi:subclass B1 metallo-beta-lactamase [Plebeiibacterium marinum]|uniref:beta-lactamase n=1 Tax=Plebeiibacterium marinum TaxID=2992111 RepID=A0AAE3SLL6_9BACT|nr:subclass B1 metallo-beta-lactamase [Plebeiobacterium marinum]MCW3807847.1 subclass B1 metallo-beta-lactamase [Plebeiobacterium marinum]